MCVLFLEVARAWGIFCLGVGEKSLWEMTELLSHQRVAWAPTCASITPTGMLLGGGWALLNLAFIPLLLLFFFLTRLSWDLVKGSKPRIGDQWAGTRNGK